MAVDANDLPMGWRNIVTAFNKDIKELIESGKLVSYDVVQAKEKYGTMRVYADIEASDDISITDVHDIEYAYEAISERTCIYCGKRPVPMIDAGWISPVCRDCYINHRYSMVSYDNVAKNEPDLSTTITIKTYRDGHSFERTIDLQPYLAKVDAIDKENKLDDV